MEKHKCKLCTRSFTSGRALGGHMKAHLATLPHHTTPSTSTLFSFSSSPEISDEKSVIYRLRENHKKTLNLSDPNFSFPTTEYIVHDKESETESKNPTNRKLTFGQNSEQKKLKQSLIDSHSPEHEVAISLMMLSRDKWKINVVVKEESQSLEAERSMEEIKFIKVCGKCKCEKCGMNFRSSRAMESHNNICLQNEPNLVAATSNHHKIFKCLFCSKVFGSGQALGGHKRSHIHPSSKKKNCFIDLNLPPSLQESDDRNDHSVF